MNVLTFYHNVIFSVVREVLVYSLVLKDNGSMKVI